MTAHRFPLARLPLAVLMAFGASVAHAQSAANSSTTAPELTAPTVEVSASADASAAGLEPAYAGGQVSSGGRVGFIGNMDFMETPFNSTNYTHELMQNQQAKSVGDVLLNDPSVRVARGFGNFQELYVIRGFPIASDDMAYNGLFGLLPRQYVATELLERVEVLRGANSFINGAAPGGGSIGGSINLLPKRAPNVPLSEVTVGMEDGGEGYVATDFARRFGPDQSTGLRLNAAVRNGDTSVDNERHELGVLAVGMDFRSSDVRLSADIGYQDLKFKQPRPSVTANAGVPIPAAPDATKNFAQPWTYSYERDTFGTLRGEMDLGEDAVIWAAAGARRGSEDNVLTFTNVSNAAGNLDMSRFDNTREDTVITGEVGIRGKLKTGSVVHSLAATAATYSLDSKNAYAGSAGFVSNLYNPVNVALPPNTFFGAGNLASPTTTQKTELTGVAVVDTMSFAKDRLLVTLGVRHQQIEDRSFNYNTGAQETHYDEGAYTPLVGLVVKASEQISLYANYAESLAKGPVAAGSVANTGQIFAPFRSKQKEIGAKYDGGSLGATIALFTTSQPLALTQSNVFTVDGEQRNRGVEFSAFGEPFKGVRVLGGVTLIEAEQEKTTGGVNDGKDAIGVPDTQVNVNGEWDIPGMEKLTLTARAIYTASQFADAANTQGVPSWTRYDIGARYVIDMGNQRLTLRGQVENLANRDYWSSTGGYPGSGYLVLAAPRTFSVTASLDF